MVYNLIYLRGIYYIIIKANAGLFFCGLKYGHCSWIVSTTDISCILLEGSAVAGNKEPKVMILMTAREETGIVHESPHLEVIMFVYRI